jgi:hypothetical protein
MLLGNGRSGQQATRQDYEQRETPEWSDQGSENGRPRPPAGPLVAHTRPFSFSLATPKCSNTTGATSLSVH